ncbi:MAG: cupin domain-containing protein [Planctomycetota bacterium]|nr:cupin domain-containing protein [Planctomycetota bacterium]
MREDIKDIAQRIKGLRLDLGVTVERLAELIEVTPEKYLAYETGVEDLPASALTELAAFFKVDLGLLLTGEVPHMSLFSVTRKGRGASVDRRHGYKYESLSATFKEARIEPFVVTLPQTESDQPIPQNIHPGQEFDFLLEGHMLVKVLDNEVELCPGDSVIFDATKPHGMKAVGGDAKFIAIINV